MCAGGHTIFLVPNFNPTSNGLGTVSPGRGGEGREGRRLKGSICCQVEPHCCGMLRYAIFDRAVCGGTAPLVGCTAMVLTMRWLRRRGRGVHNMQGPDSPGR